MCAKQIDYRETQKDINGKNKSDDISPGGVSGVLIVQSCYDQKSRSPDNVRYCNNIR